MISLFLVEDERIARESIRDNVPWQEHDILFLGDAPDGEVALPQLLEKRPDILLTDIKMPFMDGLELARIVRKELPDTRIIILSGHNEFEYARKAITLGVSKVNVNTECQLAFTASTRKYIEEGKDQVGKGFDPRKLLAPGAAAIVDKVKEKIELFGSANKA